MGGAMFIVLCGEKARGQCGALAGRGRGPVWTLSLGQVSLKLNLDINVRDATDAPLPQV